MTTVFSASLLFMTILASGPDGPDKAIVPAQENTAALQAASAQSDVDRIRQRVKEGQKVQITDDQGREWHGRVVTLTPAISPLSRTIASEKTSRTARF